MNRIAALAVLALALGGCATYGPGYTYADGNYAGPYNDGHYSAPAAGYGDYYYDRPQVVYGYPDYFYGPYGGFGLGYASWGFGYNPWFYGCCFGYRPWWGDHDGDADDWWHHRRWGDHDGDADDWWHHHRSGEGAWPHAVSNGHDPRHGTERGGMDRQPPPRWMHRPKP